MCATVFSLFSIFWLFWFQADFLTIVQHVLSGGTTQYNRKVGALLITVVLLILQQIVANATKLWKRTHALTFFPSMLVLAFISNINFSVESNSLSWLWCIAVLVLLAGWGGLIWLSHQVMPYNSNKEQTGLFSRRTWLNLLQMIVMMIGVAAFANSNAVVHYRAHAEVALKNGAFDEALRGGIRSHETDSHLTMLRAYALSKKGTMGEHLFEYPIAGNGNDLLPLRDSRSRLLYFPADSIYKHCGANPVGIYNTKRYLDLLERDSLATRAVADYRLCGLLIDKKLDEFVHYLPHYYDVTRTMPKHYREALTLYTHQRSTPSVVYHDEVMEEDWHNLQEMEKKYADKKERKGKVAERYKGSYWYYYTYE
jgi:hypothetical protein